MLLIFGVSKAVFMGFGGLFIEMCLYTVFGFQKVQIDRKIRYILTVRVIQNPADGGQKTSIFRVFWCFLGSGFRVTHLEVCNEVYGNQKVQIDRKIRYILTVRCSGKNVTNGRFGYILPCGIEGKFLPAYKII